MIYIEIDYYIHSANILSLILDYIFIHACVIMRDSKIIVENEYFL